MTQAVFPTIYVIHYTKLKERRVYLEEFLELAHVNSMWITENNFDDFKVEMPVKGKISGVSEKLVGMDLGINSRSLNSTRFRSRIEGKILFLRSYLSKKNTFSTGSLPENKTLPSSWLELQKMHLTALKQGCQLNQDWILVLEDDAVPNEKTFSILAEIMQQIKPKNTWINLNSGAGLVRTKSEKKIDKFGLFEIKPAATRCTVAYLISTDLAQKFVDTASKDGIPDWLPIDFYFQVLLRKFKAKSFWQDPETFGQGSEIGNYKSNFDSSRLSR